MPPKKFHDLIRKWRSYYASQNYQGQALDRKVQERVEQMTITGEPKKDRNYSHWAKRKDRFYPTLVTNDTIPAGVYESREDSEGNTYLREIAFPSDELVVIPGTPVAYVMEEIEEFWKRKSFFKELGLVFKRGVIFYGPAGCGKTSIIRMLANEFIEKGNGLVLSITDIDNDQDILIKLREVEPDRPILCIYEDIEKLTENKETESDVLSFLDGEKQIGNVVNVATTNKPDILEERLLKRPGRFDLVIGLNPPVEEARFVYLKRLFKAHKNEDELRMMAKETNGLGMAHLRELAVSILAFGRDFEQTLKRLRGNIKETFKMPKVGDREAATGFTIGFSKKENESGN